MKLRRIWICLFLTISLTACKENVKAASAIQSDEQNVELLSGSEEQDNLDNYIGSYTYRGELQNGGTATIDLLIFKEKEQLFGYLNIQGYRELTGNQESSEIEERILANVRRDQDGIGLYFLDHTSAGDDKGTSIGHYQKNELLFTLKKEGDQIITVWGKPDIIYPADGKQSGFTEQESYFYLELINEKDREMFLRANGILGAPPLYEYYDEDGSLRLEFYYDPEKQSGTGIFHDTIMDSKIMCGFPVGRWETGTWEDRKFSLKNGDEDGSELEGYKETRRYNDRGQLTYFCSEGIITGWSEPFLGKLIEIEFTYRDDGTLWRKDSYYSSYFFSTARSSEVSYFDEKERLAYVSAYITHGYLEDYYIYEGDSRKPTYCLTLDHMGMQAIADQFIRFTE